MEFCKEGTLEGTLRMHQLVLHEEMFDLDSHQNNHSINANESNVNGFPNVLSPLYSYPETPTISHHRHNILYRNGSTFEY